MKKSLLFIALAISLLPLKADEGMWLLPLLEKMNSGRMTELGFEITPEEIYNLNNSSLKDAIVIFGGGCTGEIVSKNGLLFTNHHCGYSNIQALSTVEHNYLKDGYWAMNLDEELPAEGLAVRFLESFTDVTKKVEKRIKKAATAEERDSIIAVIQKEMAEKAGCDGRFIEGDLTSFYGDNTYYFIVYKVYRDVRFVGAPPSSIGKFGADTDNWMWPRHTGDFSVFRVYAGPDNAPAYYSEENVPYNAAEGEYLKISLKGYEAGSPAMVMGYPGRTNRFMTSSELVETREKNEAVIKIRGTRQEVLMQDMRKDPKIMIQYASKYAGSSNGWKKWIGMNETFEKLDVEERRREEETKFTEWVESGNGKRREKYGEALAKVSKAVSERKDDNLMISYLNETVGQIELLDISGLVEAVAAVNQESDADKKRSLEKRILQYIPYFYKDYSLPTDKKVASAMIGVLKESVPAETLPAFYRNIDNDFGGDIDAFVNDLYDRSCFTSQEKATEEISRALETGTEISDPAYEVLSSLRDAVIPYYKAAGQWSETFREGKKEYIAGTLEMRKGEAIYPDANFTLRLTFGEVMPYSPKDAVYYDYYTTLDGVMEKEDPDNWEYEVPSRLKELWEEKDYGEYALPDGRLPIAFISNLDITGGNSGSPIMNGKGELIGLAFDGNWEAMSGDVIFEPNYQRCISVDVRYVLFIIDKFGGAGYLLDEMDIVR